jgi:hypothetical protein
MPWTITVLPPKPPSMKRSPLRTSVRVICSIGDAVVVGAALVVGAGDTVTDAAADTTADGVAGDGLAGVPHAMRSTSEALSPAPSSTRLLAVIPEMYVRHACAVLPAREIDGPSRQRSSWTS